ncbi:ECs1072 family phage-associated protein [Serratia marcescens]|uniref:Uncharacterized protein n=1 Tax=Serratia marcescens TaxID=615 RepID=A0A9X8VM65_SERMA|nr:hypothetical protein [Serratia marcescens]MBS3894884.1 hypothetical protein [Serratia marcescens]
MISTIKEIEELYTKTRSHVAKVRNIKLNGDADIDDLSRVSNRAVHLCFLELYLERHRYVNGLAGGISLSGRTAMHHSLLLKYKWPLSEIRALSLHDSLLALQEDIFNLDSEQGPTDVVDYLYRITAGNFLLEFPNIIDDEWNPELAGELILFTQD